MDLYPYFSSTDLSVCNAASDGGEECTGETHGGSGNAEEILTWQDWVQLPIYRDASGNIYVKPNDVFEKDNGLDYQSGKYELKFDCQIASCI